VGYAPSFDGEDLARLERLSPAPPLYLDWRTMLGEVTPSLVVACGRLDQNARVSLEAMRLGCHVMSEKPAALTLDDVALLREAIARNGVQYELMLAMRYEPALFTAHQVVSRGLIGEPAMVTAQKSYRWGNSRPAWYADRSKYGSTMGWVGIHAFDFARWVSGQDYVRVAAHHATRVHTDRPGCQDVATVIAELGNGGTAAFNLDFLRPEAAPTHGDDRLRIAGSQGVLEVCDQGARLQVTTADKHTPEWPLVEVNRSLLGDLVAAIEGRGALLVPASEALSITEFAIKAAQAADSGGFVTV